MPEPDPLIRHFEEILADPEARPATKVAAGKELARLREREPAEVTEPLGIMQAIVEQWCPQTPEERDLDPDPMRDLDFQAFTGRTADPVAFSWLPYCPTDAAKAERAILAATRRLGVGTGPYESPEDDELSRRGKTRAR
jgi:hypothetical protein